MRSLLKRRPRATAEYNDEGLRRVHVRGSIEDALAAADGRTREVRDGTDASPLDRVSPETPRPAEMLEHVTVEGDDVLTAGDMKLHELLVAYAYEQSKRVMEAGREYTMPTSYAIRFLGEHARRATVRDALKRLRSTTVCYGTRAGRRYDDVPLLSAWMEGEGGRDEIVYSIPSAIETLMASQLRYAYLELAALSRMRSRYGIRLYRHLALALADRKARWVPGLDNLHEVTVSVEEMKAWLGFDGGHVGQLQLRALKPALADLDHVRLFSHVKTEAVKGKRRGGGIDAWTLTLRVNPPAAHAGRMQGVAPEARALVGGWDVPMFRIARQDFWQRKGAFLVEHRHMGGFADAFAVWLLAVHEALTGNPVTDGFATRAMRGERLLTAIKADGPEDAATRFLAEEIEAPDLLAMPADVAGRRERLLRIREARSARIARWKEYKKEKGIKSKADIGKEAESVNAPAPKPKASPASKAPAPVAAPTPVPPTFGPLTWVEFLIAPGVRLKEIEAMADGIFEMTFEGEGMDGPAPVEATIRFPSGIGTDTIQLGALPLADADISFIAGQFDTIIEKVRHNRTGA
ncbi:replication initiation protein [Microvirga calopogonii]|uniref:replication initiation protein n=1 Tax=Microvirga calopogonii TaxID=2078013 RepID=UPI000E0D72B0|nr:replication initiation protein [Microvirga calopogonii]